MKIDWKRLYSVKVHNDSESSDKHDIIKLLIVRILKRKYRGKNPIIYTEYNPIEPNISYPDIFFQDSKGNVYIYEIQKEITSKWQKEIMEKYKEYKLIIIPTKKLSDNINELAKQLSDYI